MNSRPLAYVLATWFGCGYSPVAPGTIGSIGALGVAWLLVAQGMPVWVLAALAVVTFPIAAWASRIVEGGVGEKDPGIVVIDEVVGQWLALAAIDAANWQHWLWALILFRVFDIAKPFGIRRLEAIGRGYGVVADDAAAGACAMIGILVIRLVFP